MMKGFNIFPFMDKNVPNKDVDIPNLDSHDLFTSWGKNSLESRNQDVEYFGSYMDIKSSFTDKDDTDEGICISNIDTFIPFVSRGKNPLDREYHIMDYFNANEDIFFPFKDSSDLI